MTSNRTLNTTCAYCGVGCGIQAQVLDAATRQTRIAGDPTHPANFGRLCSKGAALADTLTLQGRLLHPEVNGETVSWDAALDLVATTLSATLREHGPESVAFYLSGQLLTEDYYVANKLMKGFLGSANVDTNSRLCMSSSVAGHKRAFGADIVPGCYEDLELADLIILTGSNTAWCHPVVYQRIKAAKQQRPQMKVVVIDPRRTATCDIADLHLPLQPGTDAWLFNGLLAYLARLGALDYEYLEQHTEGFGRAIKAARAEDTADIVAVARHCGLKEGEVAAFYDWFRRTPKTVTAYSQGVNQSSSGSDKVNAIINCHLATGRIGKPGMGPFSLTGQPNAMGGREVGGLANQLAAHMDFTPDNVERVGRFWNAARMASQPGLKAVDLFDAVADGRIKAIWIMGTNPVVSMPDADKVAQALSRCDKVIVSDCIRRTDTTEYANILLPALGWGEKDGTVTNSERRISRQRAFLPAPGEAKADWWIVSAVAQRMGFGAAFNYRNSRDIFIEHAALSGFENTPEQTERVFDISALETLTDAAYDALEPIQWPVNAATPQGAARLFEDGGYLNLNHKALLLPITPQPPQGKRDERMPFALNTGRIRDQWHTMTRTALAPQLNAHLCEPYCAIHPHDAQRLGVAQNDLVRLRSHYGALIARADLTDEQQPGQLFVPMHWTAQFSAAGRVGALVNPVTDPHSGQPESKHTPVTLERFEAAWHGFIFSREELNLEGAPYWTKIRGARFYRYEIAGVASVADWSQWARALLSPSDQSEGEWLEYQDSASGKYRSACFAGDRLTACLFIGPTPDLPERSWLASLFDLEALTHNDRLGLLAGVPRSDAAHAGRTICACFGVGENTLRQAIRDQGLQTVEAIGQCLNAGTNCGSCIPELQKLL
ncbi:molybdopterin-dependent oxidoreductase [Hahella sp. NBU794]|uniref:molybdopterin-dependent oxidoreductase n=1 Tax=Hahella sp. NBU794 TaxID=3422590 RepID=UPI003D6E0579